MSSTTNSAIAVYCGASYGTQKAFELAAVSLGRALAKAGRGLVYGGGNGGIMGIVSSTVRDEGGDVLGVIPYAMVASGGEGEQRSALRSASKGGKDEVKQIAVRSMHERKTIMADRSCGFIGLPGGYGTYEEVLEVTTWTQLGIHNKPVVVVNVLGFYDPLRDLIRNGVRNGFIRAHNEALVVFVDGPPLSSPNSPTAEDVAAHELFDWGTAAVAAIERWTPSGKPVYPFDWSREMPSTGAQDLLQDKALHAT
ncbi:hypothetical protein PUNSTDRAFT_70434 [Punctularia strigosozonata HHB-11173 SS5]|uniref:uncharacterized protein n=1 Tax=Punctularia strigosozonata (strain HHB-11173) TaxID=741275 RepID=UPI00044168CD|nr:uncharacterized protein PUNSTDRAFT_70434 [Punctularia strigosozonata HHB-11173 SS5]EIN08031.1 hypothetical protein PUNSTDRAFT_70434 [Punctularia strigosozonata HHB-11173 SS5]